MIMKEQDIKIRIEEALELLKDLDRAGQSAENAMKNFDPTGKAYAFGFGFMEAYVKSKVDTLKFLLEDIK